MPRRVPLEVRKATAEECGCHLPSGTLPTWVGFQPCVPPLLRLGVLNPIYLFGCQRQRHDFHGVTRVSCR